MFFIILKTEVKLCPRTFNKCILLRVSKKNFYFFFQPKVLLLHKVCTMKINIFHLNYQLQFIYRDYLDLITCFNLNSKKYCQYETDTNEFYIKFMHYSGNTNDSLNCYSYTNDTSTSNVPYSSNSATISCSEHYECTYYIYD